MYYASIFVGLGGASTSGGQATARSILQISVLMNVHEITNQSNYFLRFRLGIFTIIMLIYANVRVLSSSVRVQLQSCV